MSETVDDLMEAFRTGFRQRMQGPGIRPEGDIAIRAGIAAVAEWMGENGKPYEAAALRAAAGGGE